MIILIEIIFSIENRIFLKEVKLRDGGLIFTGSKNVIVHKRCIFVILMDIITWFLSSYFP